MLTALVPVAGAVGKKVGGFFSSYDVEKDARRQDTARTLYAAAMNGDRNAAAQLRCFGAVPLKAGDLELLIAASGGKHDAAYFSKCGFGSEPAKQLARNLARQLDTQLSGSGINSGNPATLGDSPMRTSAGGAAYLSGASEEVGKIADAGVPLLVGLALLGAFIFWPHKGGKS